MCLACVFLSTNHTMMSTFLSVYFIGAQSKSCTCDLFLILMVTIVISNSKFHHIRYDVNIFNLYLNRFPFLCFWDRFLFYMHIVILKFCRLILVTTDSITMYVSVYDLGGNKLFEQNVDLTCTLYDLQMALAPHSGVCPGHQILFLGDTALNEFGDIAPKKPLLGYIDQHEGHGGTDYANECADSNGEIMLHLVTKGECLDRIEQIRTGAITYNIFDEKKTKFGDDRLMKDPVILINLLHHDAVSIKNLCYPYPLPSLATTISRSCTETKRVFCGRTGDFVVSYFLFLYISAHPSRGDYWYKG